MKRTVFIPLAAIILCFSLPAFSHLRTKQRVSISRQKLSPEDHKLYDSLLNTASYRFHKTIRYNSRSFSITDTVSIKKLAIDSLSGQNYFPGYLQFSGELKDFLKYIVVIDKSLDSIVWCQNQISIYASGCDQCDTGFFSGTRFLPTQFNYYRFHEIYGSLFKYKNINEIQVLVNGQNKTYLPYASDLSVYAPSGIMKKSFYIPDVDYGRFFPVDFPSDTADEFRVDQFTGDFMWSEEVALKKVKAVRKEK